MHYVQSVQRRKPVYELLSSENSTLLREQSWFQWSGCEYSASSKATTRLIWTAAGRLRKIERTSR